MIILGILLLLGGISSFLYAAPKMDILRSGVGQIGVLLAGEEGMRQVQTIQDYYYFGIVAMLIGSVLVIGGLVRRGNNQSSSKWFHALMRSLRNAEGGFSEQRTQYAPPSPILYMPQFHLEGIGGPVVGVSMPLESGKPIVIGRDPGSSIPLINDPLVSRRHARVELTNSGALLQDEGSSNGTLVNGFRATSHLLHNGDVFQIGSAHFRFRS